MNSKFAKNWFHGKKCKYIKFRQITVNLNFNSQIMLRNSEFLREIIFRFTAIWENVKFFLNVAFTKFLSKCSIVLRDFSWNEFDDIFHVCVAIKNYFVKSIYVVINFYSKMEKLISRNLSKIENFKITRHMIMKTINFWFLLFSRNRKIGRESTYFFWKFLTVIWCFKSQNTTLSFF